MTVQPPVTVALVVPGAPHVPLSISSRMIPLEELVLLPPLLSWLWTTRRVRRDSLLAYELRWLGRRVDLATRTRTGRTASFELKMSHITRGLEQAVYNRAVFDRSYLVTAAVPRDSSLTIARDSGVGVILVRDHKVIQLLRSPYQRADPRWRRRVLHAMSMTGD